MNFKDKLAMLRRQKGAQFASFRGNDMGESPLFAGYKGYASANGGAPAGIQVIDKSTLTTLTVQVKNTDTANDLYVDLFNFNQGFQLAFDGVADSAGTVAGAGVGLIVSVNNQSMEIYNRRSASQPALIEGFRGFYPTPSQLAQNLQLLSFANNRQTQDIYSPQSHISAGQQQSNQVDDRDFRMRLDADSGMRFLVEKAPGVGNPTLINLVFNLRAIQDSAELLNGKSPLGLNPGQLGGNNLY